MSDNIGVHGCSGCATTLGLDRALLLAAGRRETVTLVDVPASVIYDALTALRYVESQGSDPIDTGHFTDDARKLEAAAAHWFEIGEQRVRSDVEDQNEVYKAAKVDPIVGPIIDALYAQDARTYHGRSGDIVALAKRTAAKVEAAIRADERRRVADLLSDHAD